MFVSDAFFSPLLAIEYSPHGLTCQSMCSKATSSVVIYLLLLHIVELPCPCSGACGAMRGDVCQALLVFREMTVYVGGCSSHSVGDM